MTDPSTPRAFVIGRIRVKDAALWTAYRQQVPQTLLAWQGRVLVRGQFAVDFSGEAGHTDTVVIGFPDEAAMRGWHDSPAYQALVPLRLRAAEVVLSGYLD
jgi:uncharacterized protein (DUF1330 family)